MSAAAAAAELQSASKHYASVRALDSVSLTVQAGETVALLGPNGAGKTTAISLMLGLRTPTSGKALLFGRDPRDPASRKRLGAMLQESGVPGTLRVREVVELFHALYERPLPVRQVIATADLEHRAEARVASLSGGERQRLYFAVALVGNPDLLFLDEPTAALDVETRRRFWSVIKDLIRQGKTLVLTTHYLEEADALADRIIVVDRGRVVAEGSPATIKSRVGGRYLRFASSNATTKQLESLPGTQRVTLEGERWTLLSLNPEQALAQLFASGTDIVNLEVVDAGLEEAFVALTSREPHAPQTP